MEGATILVPVEVEATVGVDQHPVDPIQCLKKKVRRNSPNIFDHPLGNLLGMNLCSLGMNFYLLGMNL